MTEIKTWKLVVVAAILTIIAGVLLQISNVGKNQRVSQITNFDECAAAGYPIMESYPERCATPDGRTFVNERQQSVSYPSQQPTSNDSLGLQANGCAVAGCSGQLCVSADEAGSIVSTCEYRSEYACYKEASCEPQADGKCGWTQTPELQRCLANPPAIEGEMQVY